ncbi:growth hormone-inducible transmembrane protein [Lampetra fluviatilis]
MMLFLRAALPCSRGASLLLRPARIAHHPGASPSSPSSFCYPPPPLVRNLATRARSAARRVEVKPEAWRGAEAAMKVESLGRLAVAGGGVISIGALCYYGLGLSNEPGAIERASLWPNYVRERVRDTYTYLGATISLTAASAALAARSPTIMNLAARSSWLAIGVSFVAVIGSGMLVRSIPYEGKLGVKHAAWALHAGLMGLLLCPMVVLGGPLLLRAACYSGGLVGALSAVAVCAPSDRFLYMGGPLAAGLGVVVAASLGSVFLPAGSAFGSALYSLSLYGGLLLFGALLLYDTQRVVRRAETYPPPGGMRPAYDPINGCLSIYMDIMNIFIRIATIMAGGGSRRK